MCATKCPKRNSVLNPELGWWLHCNLTPPVVTTLYSWSEKSQCPGPDHGSMPPLTIVKTHPGSHHKSPASRRPAWLYLLLCAGMEIFIICYWHVIIVTRVRPGKLSWFLLLKTGFIFLHSEKFLCLHQIGFWSPARPDKADVMQSMIKLANKIKIFVWAYVRIFKIHYTQKKIHLTLSSCKTWKINISLVHLIPHNLFWVGNFDFFSKKFFFLLFLS